MKKMAGNQNVSVSAADKCPETEGLTFTVEKMAWGGKAPQYHSFFVQQGELELNSGGFGKERKENCMRRDTE